MTRILFAALVALAIVAVTPARAAEGAVSIDNFTFSPKQTKVKVGATVTWTNHDDIPHTVVSKDNLFKSNVLDTDNSFSFTFTAPGSYVYFCSLHPHMTGTIVVEAAGGNAPK